MVTVPAPVAGKPVTVRAMPNFTRRVPTYQAIQHVGSVDDLRDAIAAEGDNLGSLEIFESGQQPGTAIAVAPGRPPLYVYPGAWVAWIDGDYQVLQRMSDEYDPVATDDPAPLG